MKKDIWVGLIILGLSVLFALDLKGVQNPDLIKNQVGVALFPWMMIVVLGFLGLFLSLSALLKMRREKGAARAKAPGVTFGARYLVPFVMFLILTIYILLVPVVGFYVMSFLFFTALGLLLGGFQWRNVIRVSIGAVATVAAVYGIFQMGLQLWMPQGLLF